MTSDTTLDRSVINRPKPPQSQTEWEAEWPVGSAIARSVVKIVLGELGKDKAQPGTLPADLATRFPSLTHLHVWGLKGIKQAPALPNGLECLDLRDCAALQQCSELPEALTQLILEDLQALEAIKLPKALIALRELSFRGAAKIPEEVIVGLLAMAPNLRDLDLAGSQTLRRLPAWPSAGELRRIRLDGCHRLDKLPAVLPAKLMRLDLSGCGEVTRLPEVAPESLDYLDVRDTPKLRNLPRFQRRPRTVFLHGCGVPLPDQLFGAKDTNTAERVFEHQRGEKRLSHEVKVILIGNGRSGKSSLAKVLTGGELNPEERTTHGIRLWSLDGFPFKPVDEAGVQKASLQIWDFAGQDLYRSTHRLFYQSRAVFVVCESAAGPGYDLKTDSTDNNELPTDSDFSPGLEYWLAQIRAIPPSPGRMGPPPVIFVRTKADRDDEPGQADRTRAFKSARKVTLGKLPVIDFGGRTKQGLQDLEKELSKAVAEVLGERGRREALVEVLDVQAALEPKLAANAEAYEFGERRDVAIEPPFPLLQRTEFDRIVQQRCSREGLASKPELVMEFLSERGFLFAHPRFSKNWLVLDQRWAIEGIYTAFERQKAWPELLEMGGRCTMEDLQRWGWKNQKPEHQVLFRDLLLACRMAYSLGTNRRGVEEFVVPRALPSEGLGIQSRLARKVGGRRPTMVETIDDARLGRDAALDILSILGARWQRAAELWRYGGWFESFRHWGSEGYETGRSRSAVRIQWTPQSKDAFGGTLQFELFGEDRSLLASILERVRSSELFSEISLPKVPVDELHVRHPDIGEAGTESRMLQGIDSHDPKPWMQPATVGLSFKGDDGQKAVDRTGRDWRSLPEDSLERWPWAVAESLDALGLDVEQYRQEQNRAAIEQAVGRRDYLDRLTEQDYLVAFLSSGYLRSEYCMFEFMKMVEVSGSNRQDVTRCWAGKLPGTLTKAPKAKEGDGFANEEEFKKLWKKKVTAWKKTLGRVDLLDAPGVLARRAESHWMQCVSDNARRDQILNAIWGSTWSLFDLRMAPTDQYPKSTDFLRLQGLDNHPFVQSELTEHGYLPAALGVACEIYAAFQVPETLYRLAEAAWERRKGVSFGKPANAAAVDWDPAREALRAKWFWSRAGEASSRMPQGLALGDGLRTRMQEPVRDDVRVQVKEDLGQLGSKAPCDWAGLVAHYRAQIVSTKGTRR